MIIQRLLDLPRQTKRALLFVTDMALLVLCLTAAFSLRYGTLNPWDFVVGTEILYVAMLAIGAIVFNAMRLPRIKLHAMESSAMLRIGSAAILLALAAMSVSFLFKLTAPRSVPLIFGALFFLTAVLTRVFALHILMYFGAKLSKRVRVAIYGAGAAGMQLASALNQSTEANPVLFVDDNPNMKGLLVNGLHVFSPADLEKRLAKHRIDRILVAIPSLSQRRRSEIVRSLAQYAVEVMVLPSYVDIMADGGLVESLRPVSPDELLGRDKVALDTPEIEKTYANSTVMVTGAGGSIGSELCRQLLNCTPSKIVLFEQSEFALYAIDRELREILSKATKNIEVVTRLGSVTNRDRVKTVVREEGVEIILHAAAYKHVPIVEDNELEGARNNVLGTQTVADVAMADGLDRFILVSTDKAVRPTNIMGATKRMAELVVQDMQTRSQKTKFAMVRFGNVLGSSGSVLPLFERQIRAGGPVTVTHEEVTRYFMTIPEASRLVLLAGAYAEGGDLFVLDMGQPQKIMDIAKRMISLSGLEVKDPVTGLGDIEIEVVGLRAGEKLYEELLIDDDSLIGTPHPKIMRAEETMLSEIEVAGMLREILASLDASDRTRLRGLIENRVDGYHKPEAEQLPA